MTVRPLTYGRLENWSYDPLTKVSERNDKRITVELCGPDLDDDIEINLIDRSDGRMVFVPVEVLANHLRLAGWTVTPPASRAEGRKGSE